MAAAAFRQPPFLRLCEAPVCLSVYRSIARVAGEDGRWEREGGWDVLRGHCQLFRGCADDEPQPALSVRARWGPR